MQGFVNSAVVMEMLKTRIMYEEALKIDGTPVIDPNQIYYYGNSQVIETFNENSVKFRVQFLVDLM